MKKIVCAVLCLFAFNAFADVECKLLRKSGVSTLSLGKQRLAEASTAYENAIRSVVVENETTIATACISVLENEPSLLYADMHLENAFKIFDEAVRICKWDNSDFYLWRGYTEDAQVSLEVYADKYDHFITKFCE